MHRQNSGGTEEGYILDHVTGLWMVWYVLLQGSPSKLMMGSMINPITEHPSVVCSGPHHESTGLPLLEP